MGPVTAQDPDPAKIRIRQIFWIRYSPTVNKINNNENQQKHDKRSIYVSNEVGSRNVIPKEEEKEEESEGKKE